MEMAWGKTFFPAESAACPDPSAEPLSVRFARGDEAAFDELVATYYPRVAGLARRLLGWPDDVADVAQDVFVSALKNAKRFRGDANLSTWLTRITINACRSHRRRRLVRINLLGRLRGLVDSTSTTGARKGEGQQEKADAVRAAVRSLPAKLREVVVLRYLEGMPVAQIVEMLGLSRNSVEVRLTRGRQYLKSTLKDVFEER